MQNAWIISIGSELTLGQSVDTNSAWLSQQLAALGIRVDRHVTVADDLAAIVDVLRQAASACDLVLITGGLGPTDDDLTRAALAEAAATTLSQDDECLEQIRAFFVRRGREMPESNRVQALLPVGGSALPNACGTAPGIFVELAGTGRRCPSYALPGVPFEMKEMFARHVAPRLQAAGQGRVLVHRRLRCFGLGESEIGARMRDLMLRGRNPEVGTTADLGEIGIRIYATADSPAAAASMLDETAAEIRRRFGPVVFGDESDSLASVVVRELISRRRTVCTAESCTGGLIGAMLTDVPGSSAAFLGGVVTYANAAKERLAHVPHQTLAEHGAVSSQTAEAMAAGVRQRFEADYALAVTGIAGPGGGSAEKPVGLVYLALLGPEGSVWRELRLGEDASREVIRIRAARGALNLLRLRLIDAR